MTKVMDKDNAHRLPPWLKKRMPILREVHGVKAILAEGALHTVCEEAMCPNLGECFSQRTATFMILGDICTRNCHFCAVKGGRPAPVDEREPENVARAARKLGLKHVVVTSVSRDDLEDGGASHFVATIRTLKALPDSPTVEVLTPDFGGDEEALRSVIEARPEVFNHNMETVERLYPLVRPQADYWRSLRLLKIVKQWGHGIYTKTGFMLGLGERQDEVRGLLQDIVDVGCDIVTIGQYLSPSAGHLAVARFYEPWEFKEIGQHAQDMGIRFVASEPFVRSSYQAREALLTLEAAR